MDALVQREVMALLQRGELQRARTKAESICRAQCVDAQSWMLLASVYAASGDIENVRDCCEKVLAFDVNNFPANYNYAIALENLGDVDQAVIHYEKIVALFPDSVDVYLKLGNLYHKLLEFNKACICFQAVLKVNAAHIGAVIGLGNALLEMKKYDESIDCYLKLLKVNPDLLEANFNLGTAYYRSGKNDLSIRYFQNVIRIKPDNSDAYNSLGAAFTEKKYYDNAIASYQKAVDCRNDDVAAYTNLGNVYSEVGLMDDAVACHLKAIEIDPEYETALYNLGSLYAAMGELEKAELVIDKAYNLSPEKTDAIVWKAVILEIKGEVEAAFQLLHPLVEKGEKDTNFVLTYASLEVSRTKHEAKEVISLLEAAVLVNGLTLKERASLHFSLGDKYNELGDYGKAFKNYEKANNLVFTPVEMKHHHKLVDNIISSFSNIDSLLKVPNDAASSPIFIVGMPRSGTSLVEQILSTNDDVFGAGELPDMQEIIKSIPDKYSGVGDYPQCISHLKKSQLKELSNAYIQVISDLSESEKYVTDKTPFNYLHLGMIAILFPNAKIIHCTRDPVDTCLSCYFNHFIGPHPYFQNLTTLGEYYKSYHKLMEFWQSSLEVQILELSYESLVKDQLAVSKSIMEFCDLEWNKSCLEFYKSKRISNTASYNQVRKPIYTKSVRRRDKYAAHIDELLQALDLSE